MTKVVFGYKEKFDAWSWVLIAQDKDLWGIEWEDQVTHIPPELLAKIEKARFWRAQNMVMKHLVHDPLRKNKRATIKIELMALEQAWRIVEDRYFDVLATVTKKPIFRKKFACYMTTGYMCPYNEKEKWFMTSLWHSTAFSVVTVCHEIMHLQFLFYYGEYIKKCGLTVSQQEDLKESLTFLLNEEEFHGMMLCEDVGYPDHEKLRAYLQKIWRKERDFDILIDRAIVYMKKHE